MICIIIFKLSFSHTQIVFLPKQAQKPWWPTVHTVVSQCELCVWALPPVFVQSLLLPGLHGGNLLVKTQRTHSSRRHNQHKGRWILTKRASLPGPLLTQCPINSSLHTVKNFCWPAQTSLYLISTTSTDFFFYPCPLKAHPLFPMMCMSRQFRSLQCKLNSFKNSSVPTSIRES